MSPLDIVIVLAVIASVYIGYRRGAIVGVFSFLGLFLGVLIGARIDLHFVHPSNPSLLINILQGSIVAILGGGLFILGEILGRHLRVKILATKLYKPDKYIGLLVGLVGGLIVASLCSSLILNNSSVNAQNVVLESKILTYVDQHSLFGYKMANAFYLIYPDQSIQVGDTNLSNLSQTGVSAANYSLPTQGPFVSAINKDYNSVVFIEWEGCGELHFGSGYVSSSHIVVTAAHVIAGSGLVRVSDKNHSYVGTVVLLDSKKDLAVLYVPGLPDAGLNINATQQNNSTPVMMLGYKQGGPLTDGIGTIQRYDTFSNYDISVNNDVKIGRGTTFYQSNAASNHGDSGGPLIMSDGSVIGHLSFGHSADSFSDNTESYYVAAGNYIKELQATEKSHHRVSTGSCLSFSL